MDSRRQGAGQTMEATPQRTACGGKYESSVYTTGKPTRTTASQPSTTTTETTRWSVWRRQQWQFGSCRKQSWEIEHGGAEKCT